MNIGETVSREDDRTTWSDEARLVSLARTDETAFSELYQGYLRRVFRYLLTYTESTDDAADLTQHVFLRVLEALDTYEDRGVPFGAWLFRIARNVATDTYRRRRKTLPWGHIPAAWQPFSSDDPEATAIHHESLNRLRLLVAQLDPEKQDLLYLRFAGELTAAEIGAVVGKKPATVQKQLQRTIQFLKERYGEPSI